MKNNTENEFVTLSLKRYRELVDADNYARCLVQGGVDNWEWYGESLEDYNELTLDEARELAKTETKPE